MTAAVSSFSSAVDVDNPKDFPVSTVLEAIRTGGKTLKGQITQIRNQFEAELALTSGDRKAAKRAVEPLKKQLPGVTWSGKFSQRANDKLVEYSGLLCGDVDSLGESLPQVREKIQKSPHVFAVFISPTGDGLKLIVRVPADVAKHAGSFRAMQKHVLELTGTKIDESGKDAARLCFMSYDPELYINTNAQELEPLPELEKPTPTNNNVDRNSKPNKAQVREMLAVIPKRPDYADWIRLVSAVGDALPDDDAIEVLREWSDEERPGEYEDKLRHRLEDVHVGTLFHVAQKHGWQTKRNEARAPVVRDDSEWITDLSSLEETKFPAPLGEGAFRGLAGKIVSRILPETEAHPAALLTDFLTGFGNIIGRHAYAVADGVRHYCNLFVVTVGPTSTARKGTAWKRVLPVLRMIDEDWVNDNIEVGLSSGEGVIHRIRNKIEEIKPIREKGRHTGEYETVTTDPGVDDKRLLIVETEFCNPLKVMARDGNTLSPVLRTAWDGDTLSTLTKHSRERATEPYVSMIGHITREELKRNLTETEAANGFGNRHLWIAVKRWQSLPKGGQTVPIADFLEPLQDALLFAQTCGELRRDGEAEELWAHVYSELSDGKPGLVGSIIARAAPQVLRLSETYAVLDCSPLIKLPHLQAALAIWRYSEASARWIFETGTGNKKADRIYAALRAAGKKGLTKWQITDDVFNRHATKFEIDEALRLLHKQQLAKCERESTATKPAERWFYTP